MPNPVTTFEVLSAYTTALSTEGLSVRPRPSPPPQLATAATMGTESDLGGVTGRGYGHEDNKTVLGNCLGFTSAAVTASRLHATTIAVTLLPQ